MKKFLSAFIILALIAVSCGKDTEVDLDPIKDSAKISMSFFGTKTNGFVQETTVDFSNFTKLNTNKKNISKINLEEGSSIVITGLKDVQLSEVVLSIKNSKTIRLDLGSITPNDNGSYTVPVARAYTFLQGVLDEMNRTKKSQTLQITAKSENDITTPVKVELTFNATFVF